MIYTQLAKILLRWHTLWLTTGVLAIAFSLSLLPLPLCLPPLLSSSLVSFTSLSLLLTTFCLEHTPSTVACVCIHLSCRWKGLDIPRSSDGKSWWEYIDPSITRVKLDGEVAPVIMSDN